MMKLLSVDLQARFLNPTKSLLTQALASFADVHFFGPGFVDDGTLRLGLRRFIDREGPFDALVTNGQYLSAISSRRDNPLTMEEFSSAYRTCFSESSLKFIPSISEEFSSLHDTRRILTLLDADLYNWTDDIIGSIHEFADYVIAPGMPFWKRTAQMPNVLEEKFGHLAKDNWVDYASDNAHRIAAMTHIVSGHRGPPKPLAHRRDDWTILGITYAARQQARASLVANGLKPRAEGRARRAIGLLRRLGLWNGHSDFSLDYLNWDFEYRLAQSRYSYTCGSGLEMPIRKFFEIPEAGAVLVCRPFAGFAEAGFVDGVNCLVREPDQVVDTHRWLVAHPDEAQRIASAGWSLVHRAHSVAARAKQLEQTLKAMLDGTFNGSAWDAGTYSVLTR